MMTGINSNFSAYSQPPQPRSSSKAVDEEMEEVVSSDKVTDDEELVVTKKKPHAKHTHMESLEDGDKVTLRSKRLKAEQKEKEAQQQRIDNQQIHDAKVDSGSWAWVPGLPFLALINNVATNAAAKAAKRVDVLATVDNKRDFEEARQQELKVKGSKIKTNLITGAVQVLALTLGGVAAVKFMQAGKLNVQAEEVLSTARRASSEYLEQARVMTNDLYDRAKSAGLETTLFGAAAFATLGINTIINKCLYWFENPESENFNKGV